MVKASNSSARTSNWVQRAVITFFLAYGLHYFAYFIRVRYYLLLDTLALSDALGHVFRYSGHIVFALVLAFYAWVVQGDRKYIFSFLKGEKNENLRFAAIGAATGFCMMGTCILAAVLSGTLSITLGAGINFFILLLALVMVLLQASMEEIESRAFLFGKLRGERVPVAWAVIISSFFFSYIHAANPGFGIIPFISIFLAGAFYALCYHYLGNLWFCCTCHMMWNFTQDFLFGLPDSGNPAVASLFSGVPNGSNFFYSEQFGIEGSIMCMLLHILLCAAVVYVGNRKNLKSNL